MYLKVGDGVVNYNLSTNIIYAIKMEYNFIVILNIKQNLYLKILLKIYIIKD